MTPVTELNPKDPMAIPDAMSAELDSGYQDTRAELSYALKLANALHTRLDINELMELFARETSYILPNDGMEYENNELEFKFKTGRHARNACAYRLLVAGKPLGEVRVFRKAKFTEDETVQLEYLLTSLLNPLHNAILYKMALHTATRDPLTGVHNRASYDETLLSEVDLAKRHKNPLSLLILDVDHFKNINDRFGHLTGDVVLRDIAAIAKDSIRSSDMLFRYGGEEFVILLRNTACEGAMLLAERLRTHIEQQTKPYGGDKLDVTVSIGVSCLAKNDTPSKLFERADAALYRAKQAGRNRIELG